MQAVWCAPGPARRPSFWSRGGQEFSLLIAPLQSRIAAFTRVCAYDRAGYAWSDPAPEGRSFDARAADLAALLRGYAGVTGPYVMVGSLLRRRSLARAASFAPSRARWPA